MESGQKLAFMERHVQQPMDMSRNECQKCLAGRKGFQVSSRPHSTLSRSCMMLKEVARGLCAGKKG